MIATDFKKSRRVQPTADRLPPHSSEAEQGVLGCILISPQDCLPTCARRIAADDFYDLRHQTIWMAMAEMRGDLDIITLQQNLKDQQMLDQVGGIAYLSTLQDSVPSSANLTYYLEIIEEKSKLRRLLNTVTEITSRIYESDGTVNDMLDEAEQKLAKVSTRQDRVVPPKAAVQLMADDMERRLELYKAGKRSGLETGWPDLDQMTDGLQFGEQAVVGARPSMGKTAIATNLIEHICLKNKIPSAFVTLEMQPAALMRRMASSQCRVHMSVMRDGSYSESDLTKAMQFTTHTILKSPLYFVDGVAGMNEQQVCAELRNLKRKHDIQFAVVDYLQKIRGTQKEEKKTYEVGSVSSALKAVAKELNIALVTLAQLNRENEKDKGRAPRTSDLGDSKQIEQDADLIALIHRPRTNDDSIETKLLIVKQRDGETGCVNLAFIGKYCRFESATYDHQEA